jgi:hypothetical protein
MWGYIPEATVFDPGVVVGKEDDDTGVYFYSHIVRKEYFIPNDEHFSSNLVMDVNPNPEWVLSGHMVLAQFPKYRKQHRFKAFVIAPSKAYYKYPLFYYVFLISAWPYGKKNEQPYWVRQLMPQQRVKDLSKIRTLGELLKMFKEIFKFYFFISFILL